MHYGNGPLHVNLWQHKPMLLVRYIEDEDIGTQMCFIGIRARGA